MRNVREENLTEHSMEVAYITHAIVAIHNAKGGNIDIGEAVLYALYHDCSEILTGDMPTPVKYHDDDIKNAYKNVEQKAESRLVSMLPDELKPSFEKYLGKPQQEIQRFVKAADRISALIKCIEEEKMGNHDFDTAQKGIRNSIYSSNVTEAIEFVEKYLPSYGLSIDEL